MVGVGDGNGECVGRVGAGDGDAGQQPLDHGVDLNLVGIADADHGLLDEARGIFADGQAGTGGGGEHDTAGLAELQRGLRVLVDEDFLDRGGVGPMLVEQGFKLAGEIGEALGQRRVGLGLQLAVGEVGKAVALGADDVESSEDGHAIWTAADALHEVAGNLEKTLGEAEGVKLAWKPTVTVAMDESGAATLLKLVDTLDDDDDVQTVWGNYDIPDAVMEKLG